MNMNSKEFRKLIPSATQTSLTFNSLKKIWKENAIVLIGESGHGMAEYFTLKTRLVKYLHQELGFNVLAVEGSLGDCGGAQINADKLNDTLLMNHCFYQTWNFKEALPLFSYIKENQKHDNPLILSGFDNIPTGHYFPEFSSDVISKIDSTKNASIKFIAYNFIAFTNGVEKTSFNELKSTLLDSIISLENWIITNSSKINSSYPENTTLVPILLRSLDNIRETIKISIDHYSRNTLEKMRDSLMAANVLWLVDSLYPQEKIIVWAHNAHISKAYSRIPSLKKNRRHKRQGEFMTKSLSDKSFTIGLYPYHGIAWAFFIQDNYEMNMPADSSLEHRMSLSGFDISYLNMGLVALDDDEFAWVHDTVTSYEWGRFRQDIIPIEHYNALIQIKNITPPELLHR